jgi:hypothetical protein
MELTTPSKPLSALAARTTQGTNTALDKTAQPRGIQN